MSLKHITDRVLDRLTRKAVAKADLPRCYYRDCGSGGRQRCCPIPGGGTRCETCLYP